jgi:transcriptional regulator with XRE-family HTH domain
MPDQAPNEKQRRAEEFKRRVKATGLSQSEFRERSGITRNVYYNLSIGQEPKPDQRRRIEAVFADPSARVEDANK